MPHQTEPNVNSALGSLLKGMLPRSTVLSENTSVISGHPLLQPDNLILAPGRSPVVIEAEYMPATNAEAEAKSRLGLTVNTTGHEIEAAIALRYPETIGDATNLQVALTGASLSYCVFTQPNAEVERFPTSGWLEGPVQELADLVRLVSVPQRAVDEAANALQEGIELTAKHLAEVDKTRGGITRAIADVLGLVNVPQTWRMACAIVANALVFHERIAGMHEGIKPLSQVCGDSVADPKSETVVAWDTILAVNYWPIFAIAKDILDQLPAGDAAIVLRQLRTTAQSVQATGVDNAHDLTGRIFQKLIADRKYLATFYTLPASAALLARLAVAKMEGIDWGNAEAIAKLRIADFACGTGALLSAVYEEIAARHERTGGNSAGLHKAMMENVIYGCDVMPSAVHITGSTLSGIEPGVGFEGSRQYTLPYGRQSDGAVKIGSLDLLQASTILTLFNTSDPGQRTSSVGQETATQVLAEFPDKGYDLVIMNPPFTRPGSDWEGKERTEDYIKHFRGLGTELPTQKEMAKSLRRFAKNTCYHGYAGIASAFAALAHKKLKPGGVLALVLPLSAASGPSWHSFREMMEGKYIGLSVYSIAASEDDELSFSADTDMAECLVVARKLKTDELPAKRAHFTSLRRRPNGFAQGSALVSSLAATGSVRGIDNGPFGGTRVYVGGELVGEAISAPVGMDSWGAVRLSESSTAQTAYALSQSKLWLPGEGASLHLPIDALNNVGTRGVYHVNIVGSSGPFEKAPPDETATYPALWNHDWKREKRIICLPDSELIVKLGMESKAEEVWSTASRSHLSQDFRFTTQPLCVAFTEQMCVGGTAWPNVSFTHADHDYPFVLWSNSSLGLLLFWFHSNRQQSGRGRNTITSIESMPVLDIRALTDEQLAKAHDIFEEFRDKELQPAYLADVDPNRALLDRRVICDLLGFDNATYEGVRRLAAKWCAEPSVHGGKKRPKGATLVI